MDLPIIDLSSSDPNARRNAAYFLHLYGAVAVKDQSVKVAENNTFLDLMEDYFSQRTETKLLDARPEFGYQVGSTPEKTEQPRCNSDPKCLSLISSLSSENQPHPFNSTDPKWRFFWRIGSLPPETKYSNLNAKQVFPAKYDTEQKKVWESTMNSWGEKLVATVEKFLEFVCEGMELPKDCITSMCQKAPHLLAPTGSDLDKYGTVGTVLAGFHSDLNLLTIHGKSRYPGLYVWRRDGIKMPVKIPEGCLLVQAGKQLEHLTGGYILGGYHEVVVTEDTIKAKEKYPGRPKWRISSTLFYHVASDQVLKPLEALEWVKEHPESKEKYGEIKAGDQKVMALPVYAGRFRRRVFFDIFGSISVGTGLAYLWWYGHHVPNENIWRAHTAKVKLEMDEEYAQWKASQK